MSSAHRALLLSSLTAACAGLAACATGSDNGNYVPPEPDGSDMTADASADASADGVVGHADSSFAKDTGSPDTTASTDSALPESGTPSDTGAAGDAPSDAPASDTSSTCSASGTLVTFDLTSQPGNEVSAPATSMATGVASGALSRSAALTPVSGTGSINSSNWSTATTADSTRYYTFTVTPSAGCSIALTTLALQLSASTTGPMTADVATSADAFAAHTASFAGTGSATVPLTVASGTSPVEVRIYGYAATGTTGTMRIEQTMTLSGTIQ